MKTKGCKWCFITTSVSFVERRLINMNTKCNICGNEVKTSYSLKYIDLLGSGQHEYYQNVAVCPNCGYIFTQNPFSSEQLESRYSKMSKFEYDVDSYQYVVKDNLRHQCIRQKNFIEENVTDYASIFEVGAASGYNLSIYKMRRGGVEPSSLNCALAKKNYGVDLYNGMFSEYYSSVGTNRKYDLVFLSMVLEHIVNPFDFICQCGEICEKYIFVEVPTLDYKYIEEPFGMFCEEHVSMFTLESLTYMMNHAGFSLINKEIIFEDNLYLPAGYPAIASIWKKEDMTIDDNKLKPEISSEDCFKNYVKNNEMYLETVKDKINLIPDDIKLAIWGVGHHVSMLLANTRLSVKNIVRVYDSDKRKEGSKIAGIPIHPFDLNDIRTGDVEAILITTYTAQKSIDDCLKSLNINIPIYKLYDI